MYVSYSHSGAHWKRNEGYELQASRPPSEPAVVECHKLVAVATARPMQRIGEVEPLLMQRGRVLDGLPTVNGDVRHSDEIRNHIAEFCWR